MIYNDSSHNVFVVFKIINKTTGKELRAKLSQRSGVAKYLKENASDDINVYFYRYGHINGEKRRDFKYSETHANEVIFDETLMDNSVFN